MRIIAIQKDEVIMGIVEGYSADLYCDCDECQNSKSDHKKSFLELSGESKADINRDAKLLGWKITKDRMNCYAPGHAPKEGKS